MKIKILIILGRYVPGYKDGGSVRSIVNLVDTFHQQFEFFILTKDRDNGDTLAYSNIIANQFNQHDHAKVYYASNEKITSKMILDLSQGMDFIYVCGVFDRYAFKSLMLKKRGKLKMPLIIAPMGSFSTGAINLKNKKKMIYIKVLRFLGLFEKIQWSVTSSIEANELKQIFPNPQIIHIAEDLPRKYLMNIDYPDKTIGKLDIVFVSRISVKKNLSYAIDIVKDLKSNIRFFIYGNKEDLAYYEKCIVQLNELPDHIQWSYEGEAESNLILSTFTKYHVFLFPTLSENYGHVIYEALASGTIPVISDQTPWLDLDIHQAGFVIPLNDKQEFIKKLEYLSNLNQTDFNMIRKSAHQYAKEKYENSMKNSGYVTMFLQDRSKEG